jgi:hypothetical protein
VTAELARERPDTLDEPVEEQRGVDVSGGSSATAAANGSCIYAT